MVHAKHVYSENHLAFLVLHNALIFINFYAVKCASVFIIVSVLPVLFQG